MVGPHGFVGDRHGTELRERAATGELVPNRRQWSAVSSEDVEEICKQLQVMPFAFGAMGENLRLKGVRLAEVVAGSVLVFPSGCQLVVAGQNDPCRNAAEELSMTYGPAVARYFVKAAYGLRGILGTVAAPGVIRPGDEVEILGPAAAL
jgi:MOSC domain-containing protein YiiM